MMCTPVVTNWKMDPLNEVDVFPTLLCDRLPEGTWRIIPNSKWLVTPIYKSFRPFGRGKALLRGLSNRGY